MSDPISFVMPGATPIPLALARQQPPTGGKSFAQTLEQTQTNNPATDAKATAPAKSEAIAEDLRQNLMQEYQRAPMAAGDLTQQTLMRELQQVGKPIDYLRDAVGRSTTSAPGTDIRGMLGNIETEWADLEKTLRNVSSLTTGGELIGLQARLYKVAQHIEVMSKVVDQTTGGLKTIINTNI